MATTEAEAPNRFAKSNVNAEDAKAGRGKDTEKGGKKAKKKGGKKKIIMIVLALILVAAALKFTVLKPKVDNSPAGKAAAAAAALDATKGEVLPLTDVTANLTDGHFLRVAIALQLTKSAGTVDPSEASEAIITQFSGQSVAALTGEKARAKNKTELLKSIEKLYPKKVMDLYYTAFVTQ
ncbi:MAG: flagellar protein FliL [Solirubrobacteraceae bacterium]|jgi:flagellar FliL protein|nr:flagellar protein FliL [Solirubrobacteraceae bacterium]